MRAGLACLSGPTKTRSQGTSLIPSDPLDIQSSLARSSSSRGYIRGYIGTGQHTAFITLGYHRLITMGVVTSREYPIHNKVWFFFSSRCLGLILLFRIDPALPTSCLFDGGLQFMRSLHHSYHYIELNC